MINNLKYSISYYRKNKTNSLMLMAVAFILFSSCQHESKKDTLENASPYFTNFFTGSDESVLRDVNFNINEDELQKIEKSKLYESTPDHLFYEFSFPKDSTSFEEYANVQYFFNEDNLLDIITADIYLSDSLQETHLKNTLRDYYQLRFGNPQKDDNDHDVWKGTFGDKKTTQQYNYTVALKDINGDYGVAVEYVRE